MTDEFAEMISGRAVFYTRKNSGVIIKFNDKAEEFVPGIREGDNLLTRVCGLPKRCEGCPFTARSDDSSDLRSAGSDLPCSFARVIIADESERGHDVDMSVWDMPDSPPSLLFIRDIDSALALKSFGGDISSYKDILRVYRDVGDEKLALIKKLYDERDYHNLRIEVHGLKGTSYVIGAMQLGDLAKSLEYACRDIEEAASGDAPGDKAAFIDDNIELLLSKYSEILSSIAPFTSSDRQTACIERSDDELLALVDQCIASLEIYEFEEAEQHISELNETKLDNERLLILGKAMRELKSFAYEKTVYYLKQLRDMIG